MKNPLKSIKEWRNRRWIRHGAPKWELTRAQGKRRYIIRIGLLYWLILNIWVSLSNWKLPFAHTMSAIRESAGGVISVVSMELAIQIIQLGIGCFVGFAVWEAREKQYWKTKAEQNEADVK